MGAATLFQLRRLKLFSGHLRRRMMQRRSGRRSSTTMPGSALIVRSSIAPPTGVSRPSAAVDVRGDISRASIRIGLRTSIGRRQCKPASLSRCSAPSQGKDRHRHSTGAGAPNLCYIEPGGAGRIRLRRSVQRGLVQAHGRRAIMNRDSHWGCSDDHRFSPIQRDTVP